MLIIYKQDLKILILIISLNLLSSLLVSNTEILIIALNPTIDTTLCQNCTQFYIDNFICYKNLTQDSGLNATVVETISCVCEPGFELVTINNQSKCLFIDYPFIETIDAENNKTCFSPETNMSLDPQYSHCLQNDGVLCDLNHSISYLCICKYNNKSGDFCELTINETKQLESNDTCKTWGFTGNDCRTMKAELIAIITVTCLVGALVLFIIPLIFILVCKSTKYSKDKTTKHPEIPLRKLFTDLNFTKNTRRTMYLPSDDEVNNNNRNTLFF
jgi:hypothetical protein